MRKTVGFSHLGTTETSDNVISNFEGMSHLAKGGDWMALLLDKPDILFTFSDANTGYDLIPCGQI